MSLAALTTLRTLRERLGAAAANLWADEAARIGDGWSDISHSRV
jgi:hypothetical protein